MTHVTDNLLALPGNLFEDSTYILGNGVLQAIYSALRRTFPAENDGTMVDQLRMALMDGLEDTANFVYDAERGCRIPDGETAPESFKLMLGRLWTSAPYIPVFGVIDWAAKSLTNDNGSIEALFDAASDPNHTLKVAGAQGLGWWLKHAAWNGYGSTLAFKSMDHGRDDSDQGAHFLPINPAGRVH